jgi:hypothetical protein
MTSTEYYELTNLYTRYPKLILVKCSEFDLKFILTQKKYFKYQYFFFFCFFNDQTKYVIKPKIEKKEKERLYLSKKDPSRHFQYLDSLDDRHINEVQKIFFVYWSDLQ